MSLDFTASAIVSLPPVASLTNSVALTTVQSLVNIPLDCKVVRVELTWVGTLTGTCTFNVVYGIGTSTGTAGTANANAVVNTPLFATSPTIAGTTGVMAALTPDVPDTIYRTTDAAEGTIGYPMTLRLTSTTGESDGISSFVCVNLVCQAINQHGFEAPK